MDNRSTISDYVTSILGGAEGNELGSTCQVNIRLPIKTCAELDALASVLRRNKTSLSRQLLTLAIQDAIDALPAEYSGYYDHAFNLSEEKYSYIEDEQS